MFIDRAHRLLKDDLLRGRGTDDLREVPAVRIVPVGPTDIVQAESEEEAFQPELRILQGEPRRVAGPTQIADRFIIDRWHVHARQIPGPQQPRELDGIAAIGLHLVAGLLGNERRRDDLAGEALPRQIAMQDVAAGTGFVGEHQVRCLPLEAPDQLVEVGLARPDRADEHGRVSAVALCMGNRDRILVDVQTDEQRSRLRHG